MRKLYYNHIELPARVHIVSKCFGVDVTDEEPFDKGIPVDIDALFDLAKLDCFEEVEVHLTAHNEAYIRDSKKPTSKDAVSGWVSLKSIRNGGGYLDDNQGLK